MPPSPSKPPSAPRRDLASDGAAVTEVIGYILVFGILSFVLVTSMFAFNLAQGAAEESAIQLRAESAAARVAGVVVQSAVLWETQYNATSNTNVTLAYRVELPDQLEGRDYVVELATVGMVDLVRVRVPALQITATAPIFSAGAPTGFGICVPSSAPGGPLFVRINAPAGQPTPACGHNRVFLEAA
jgi:hypothetical protein